jgi:hypothetical protein
MARQNIVWLAVTMIGCAAAARKEPGEALNPKPRACPAVPAPTTVVSGRAQQALFRPTNGFVADAETAVRIARAVWDPIYGADTIAREAPYQATLFDGVWQVMGRLPACRAEGGVVCAVKGGVAIAEICQLDGRVLGVIHEK